MSTLTEYRADSIEHLDHEPECAACHARAVFWLASHGCMDALGCTRCTENECALIEADIRKFGVVTCCQCDQPFTRREDFTKVVPL
ncbi:hypothetical protein [Nocardia asiatica]